MTSTDIKPPTFPLRPMSGGNLDKNKFTGVGTYAFEPKVNGWRTLVHTPTGTMFNRQGERLSIEKEFKPALDALKLAAEKDDLPEWLDCEAFERRHGLGRGSLVVFDMLAPRLPWHRRDELLGEHLQCAQRRNSMFQPWAHEQFAPPANSILWFAYNYERAEDQRANGEGRGGIIVDPDLTPEAAWPRLKAVNKAHDCELFEGLVAKRTDSLYPFQLVSPEKETSDWIKTRWRWS